MNGQHQVAWVAQENGAAATDGELSKHLPDSKECSIDDEDGEGIIQKGMEGEESQQTSNKAGTNLVDDGNNHCLQDGVSDVGTTTSDDDDGITADTTVGPEDGPILDSFRLESQIDKACSTADSLDCDDSQDNCADQMETMQVTLPSPSGNGEVLDTEKEDGSEDSAALISGDHEEDANSLFPEDNIQPAEEHVERVNGAETSSDLNGFPPSVDGVVHVVSPGSTEPPAEEDSDEPAPPCLAHDEYATDHIASNCNSALMVERAVTDEPAEPDKPQEDCVVDEFGDFDTAAVADPQELAQHHNISAEFLEPQSLLPQAQKAAEPDGEESEDEFGQFDAAETNTQTLSGEPVELMRPGDDGIMNDVDADEEASALPVSPDHVENTVLDGEGSEDEFGDFDTADAHVTTEPIEDTAHLQNDDDDEFGDFDAAAPVEGTEEVEKPSGPDEQNGFCHGDAVDEDDGDDDFGDFDEAPPATDDDGFGDFNAADDDDFGDFEEGSPDLSNAADAEEHRPKAEEAIPEGDPLLRKFRVSIPRLFERYRVSTEEISDNSDQQHVTSDAIGSINDILTSLTEARSEESAEPRSPVDLLNAIFGGPSSEDTTPVPTYHGSRGKQRSPFQFPIGGFEDLTPLPKSRSSSMQPGERVRKLLDAIPDFSFMRETKLSLPK